MRSTKPQDPAVKAQKAKVAPHLKILTSLFGPGLRTGKALDAIAQATGVSVHMLNRVKGGGGGMSQANADLLTTAVQTRGQANPDDEVIQGLVKQFDAGVFVMPRGENGQTAARKAKKHRGRKASAAEAPSKNGALVSAPAQTNPLLALLGDGKSGVKPRSVVAGPGFVFLAQPGARWTGQSDGETMTITCRLLPE